MVENGGWAHSQIWENVPKYLRWLGTLQECSVLPEGFIRPDVYTAFIPLILWILVTQKAMISLSIRIVY